MLIRGYKLLCMYVCRIPVKLDRNAFRSATDVGFQPVEKEEHQGCCGRIPGIRPEQESRPRFRHPKNRNKSRNVQTRK